MPEDPVSGQANSQETQLPVTNQKPIDSSTQPPQAVSQPPPQPPNLVQPPPGTGEAKPFLKTSLLIIALILVVLTATVGLVIYFSFIKKPAPISLPSETVLPRASLVIEEPQDQQATTSAQILVRGKTDPNSQVMVFTESHEEIFESDTNGNFSGVFLLDEGPNEITFTTAGDKTEENTETKSVVYVNDKEL